MGCQRIEERQYYCRFLSRSRRADFIDLELTIGILYTNLPFPDIPLFDPEEVAMKVGDILRKKRFA
jgi:hypothetical protein